MTRSLHGVSTWHGNVVTQIRLAAETGFDAVELLPEHLLRYLNHGGSIEKLKALMKKYSITISCINALKRIGRHHPEEKQQLLVEAKRICEIAYALDCPVVQIMTIGEIDDLDQSVQTDILAENIAMIADIGRPMELKFQIELVAFTSFKSLPQALSIIERTGANNVGVVIDFWHLHAGGVTSPNQVAQFDKNLIYGIHLCDGRAAHPGEAWVEPILRDYDVGEGDVDVDAWVRAVKATGYDGVWSCEQLSPKHWERDLAEIAKADYETLDRYM